MIKKFKCFFNYSKEEQWLEDMARKGYSLHQINCLGEYTFKNVEPRNITYKIDYRVFKSNKNFIDYCTLFEDCGWKHVCGNKYSGTQYFMLIDENSNKEIFSDISSSAGRYKRLSNMWLTIAISYIPILIALISTSIVDISSFIHPSKLYYTPGLWDMNGFKFLIHFLFETPFAVMRGFSWIIFLILILIYLYCSLKYYSLYKQTMKTTIDKL